MASQEPETITASARLSAHYLCRACGHRQRHSTKGTTWCPRCGEAVAEAKGFFNRRPGPDWALLLLNSEDTSPQT